MVHWEYVPQIITYTPKQTFPFLHRQFCNTATPFRCNLAKEALKLCTYILQVRARVSLNITFFVVRNVWMTTGKIILAGK